jgi:hypothetical protein
MVDPDGGLWRARAALAYQCLNGEYAWLEANAIAARTAQASR